MTTLRTIFGCVLLVSMSLCCSPSAEAACDAADEKQWEKIRNQLPTSDLLNIGILIDDLTKLHKKCDPKTRFSASVTQLLFSATFRQDELRRAVGHVRGYYSRFPILR
ncbi:MAG TPA: hypothetical protein VFS39_16205 [Nitrospira sp.]|nr:hypothetical protein [Nitrospira sp.]